MQNKAQGWDHSQEYQQAGHRSHRCLRTGSPQVLSDNIRISFCRIENKRGQNKTIRCCFSPFLELVQVEVTQKTFDNIVAIHCLECLVKVSRSIGCRLPLYVTRFRQARRGAPAGKSMGRLTCICMSITGGLSCPNKDYGQST